MKGDKLQVKGLGCNGAMDTREEFVKLAEDCYKSGKIGIELLRDMVSRLNQATTVFLTEEEFERITGKKY